MVWAPEFDPSHQEAHNFGDINVISPTSQENEQFRGNNSHKLINQEYKEYNDKYNEEMQEVVQEHLYNKQNLPQRVSQKHLNKFI